MSEFPRSKNYNFILLLEFAGKVLLQGKVTGKAASSDKAAWWLLTSAQCPSLSTNFTERMTAVAAWVCWTQGVGELLLGAGETGPAQHCSHHQPMVGWCHYSDVFQLFSGTMMASEAPAADSTHPDCIHQVKLCRRGGCCCQAVQVKCNAL